MNELHDRLACVPVGALVRVLDTVDVNKTNVKDLKTFNAVLLSIKEAIERTEQQDRRFLSALSGLEGEHQS